MNGISNINPNVHITNSDKNLSELPKELVLKEADSIDLQKLAKGSIDQKKDNPKVTIDSSKLGDSSTVKGLDAPKIEKMIKQVIAAPDFSFIVPKVQISDKLQQTLSPSELENLEKNCLEDYSKAMAKLEDSVADVSFNHPDALEFADKLSGRLFDFMEKYAEVVLEAEGRISNESDPNSRSAAIDLKVNEFLVKAFSQTKKIQVKRDDGMQESEVVQGVKNESGNIGTNPLTIRKAFKEGNLREKMYLMFKTTFGFSNDILKNPDTVAKINQKLTDSNWQIDTEMLKTLAENKSGPYAYGSYANRTGSDGLRVSVSANDRAKMVKEENAPIKDDSKRRIPLSEREQRHATGELTPGSTKLSEDLKEIYHNRAKENIKWESGSHWYRAASNENRATKHDYLTGSEALSTPGIAGISGTTDQVMTMSMLFGMGTTEELEKGRLASLGWMLDAKDHSVNEIMTSSKSFGFDYTPSPTSYQQIYSQDKDFSEKLRDAQQRQGVDLPDNYLSKEYVDQKAKELRPRSG